MEGSRGPEHLLLGRSARQMITHENARVTVRVVYTTSSVRSRPNERCSRQALFGCDFVAMVIVCLQLN